MAALTAMFPNFQMLMFNKQDHNMIEKLLPVYFYSIPNERACDTSLLQLGFQFNISDACPDPGKTPKLTVPIFQQGKGSQSELWS